MMAAMIGPGPGPLAPQVAAAAVEQALRKKGEEYEKAVSALVTREVPKALVRAVRAELRALLDGNLEDNLTQVEQVAVRARELFMSIRGPGAQFTRGMSTPIMTGQASGMLTNFQSSSGVVYPASYSNPEQFGASAIRQLVALVPEIVNAQANTPDKLMAAIALAEEKGHHDIAKALKKKLMGDSVDASDAHEAHEAHDAHDVVESGGSNGTSATVVGAALVEAGTAVMAAAGAL
jgi:hypothetical protein